ncbi:MAG: hypothetical protein E7342_00675 [Clostridiales bacterium]|nr:hypothetical protein [Clostridiales bacterium]
METKLPIIDEKVVKENEKWFNFYKIFPKIIFIAIIALFVIWSIIDVATFQYSSGYLYGPTTNYFGIMMIPSAFLALLIWWVIGGVLGTITYFCTRISCSYKILHITYLKELLKK